MKKGSASKQCQVELGNHFLAEHIVGYLSKILPDFSLSYSWASFFFCCSWFSGQSLLRPDFTLHCDAQTHVSEINVFL